MNRRDFLRSAGLLALALVIHPGRVGWASSWAVETAFGETIYRGDSAGNILVSHDSGKTWQIQTRLGQQYAVQGFSKDAAKNAYALIGFQTYNFYLVLSPGGNCWKTV